MARLDNYELFATLISGEEVWVSKDIIRSYWMNKFSHDNGTLGNLAYKKSQFMLAKKVLEGGDKYVRFVHK